jgi:hypothetical protein
MKNLTIVICFSFIQLFIANAQVKIIFDTDFGGDADDLGALAMLHHLENKGACEILAVMSWSAEKHVIPAIDAVNRFYNNPDIPLGIRKTEGWHEADWNYTKPIADKLPYKLTNEDAMEATSLYRKILSESEHKSVKIVTVGPLANIMNLIKSKPDKYSDLNGNELINAKVKEFVIMGGKFPGGDGEWNFDGGMPGVTKFVVENLEVPVVFSGFEIGVKIKTGEVFNELDPGHPLYIGFYHFSKHAPWMKQHFQGKIFDNSTYDQTAVLYAVRGGVGKYWDKVNGGYCEVDPNGDNRWIEGEPTNQSYLVLTEEPAKIEELIGNLMLGNF